MFFRTFEFHMKICKLILTVIDIIDICDTRCFSHKISVQEQCSVLVRVNVWCMCLHGGQTTISGTSPVVYKIFIWLSIILTKLHEPLKDHREHHGPRCWEMNPTIGETAKSLLHAGTTEIRGHWRRFCSSEPKSSDKTVSRRAKRYDCCHLKSFSSPWAKDSEEQRGGENECGTSASSHWNERDIKRRMFGILIVYRSV